jgi:hypothetical protein
MNSWIIRLALLVLLVACFDQVPAQSPVPDAFKPIGTCVVIQTNGTTVDTPIGLRAEGSCQTTDGGPQNCTAEIVPTGANIILDVTDNIGIPACLPLTGGSPCDFVQNGPVIFQSQRHATQSFSTGGYAVRMTTMIRQKALQQTTSDLPPSARFPLNPGRLFDVLRNRYAIAARLECSMADGDQRIFPIVGEANLSPNIRFVSKNSSEPTFDILTYRVMP